MKEQQHKKMYQKGQTNWITQLPDNIRISQLSIPGTHNSCSVKAQKVVHQIFSFAWKNQQKNIKEQLDMGVRFFDIRLKFEENEETKICHQFVCVGLFSELLNDFNSFLRENKKQFLIIMVRHQKGEQPKQYIKQRFLQDIKASQIQYFVGPKIPTVQQLRGKLYIINTNFYYDTITLHLIHPIVYENQQFIVQNMWEGPQAPKKQGILKVFLSQNKNKIKINYLTQSFGSNYIKHQGITNIFSKAQDLNIKTMAKNYAQYFMTLMQKYPKNSTGIVLMDFITKQWIDRIIQRNKYLTK